MLDVLSNILPSEVSDDESLVQAGLDSLGSVELSQALQGRLEIPLPATLLFDYPSVNELCRFLEVSNPAAYSFLSHDIHFWFVRGPGNIIADCVDTFLV